MSEPITDPYGCGTRAGYKRHWVAGEDACDPCKAAHARYQAEQRAGLHRRNPIVCGTERGYKKHQHKGERPCFDCRVAAAKAREERREAEREEASA